jgi:hypothetical protein
MRFGSVKVYDNIRCLSGVNEDFRRAGLSIHCAGIFNRMFGDVHVPSECDLGHTRWAAPRDILPILVPPEREACK